MPFRHGTSIFSRSFKQTFNKKKYMNYMAKGLNLYMIRQIIKYDIKP